MNIRARHKLGSNELIMGKYLIIYEGQPPSDVIILKATHVITKKELDQETTDFLFMDKLIEHLMTTKL